MTISRGNSKRFILFGGGACLPPPMAIYEWTGDTGPDQLSVSSHRAKPNRTEVAH